MNVVLKVLLLCIFSFVSYIGLCYQNFNLQQNVDSNNLKMRLIKDFSYRKDDIENNLRKIVVVYTNIEEKNNWFFDNLGNNYIAFKLKEEKKEMQKTQGLIENIIDYENKGLENLTVSDWIYLNQSINDTYLLTQKTIEALKQKEKQESMVYNVLYDYNNKVKLLEKISYKEKNLSIRNVVYSYYNSIRNLNREKVLTLSNTKIGKTINNLYNVRVLGKIG